MPKKPGEKAALKAPLFNWFFSNSVGEEGPRIPGVKDSRPALSRLGDYLKYRLSFIMIIIY